MSEKKRRKVSRGRGSHTHGRGFKKKARGKGHRGGVGMAGTGKRADQKKSLAIKISKNYFGRDKTLRKKETKKLEVINLSAIQNKLKKSQTEINLSGYKILANGEIKSKVKITAASASKSAIDKVKKAGGDIILE